MKNSTYDVYPTYYGPFYQEILGANELVPGFLYRYYGNFDRDPRHANGGKNRVYLMFPGQMRYIKKSAMLRYGLNVETGKYEYEQEGEYSVAVPYNEGDKGHGTTWITFDEAELVFDSENKRRGFIID